LDVTHGAAAVSTGLHVAQRLAISAPVERSSDKLVKRVVS
jgi:hypothetical protein